MSWIEIGPDEKYPWPLRPVLALMRRKTGDLPEPVKLWSRLPLAFIGFQIMWRALERTGSPLQPKLRALIRTRIAQLNHCHFCVDLNAAHAMQRGASPEQIEALPDYLASELFSDAEKAALRYADAISGTQIDIEPDLQALLREHFSNDAIIELAALCAHQNLSAKFNAALGVAAAGHCAVAGKRPT